MVVKKVPLVVYEEDCIRKVIGEVVVYDTDVKISSIDDPVYRLYK